MPQRRIYLDNAATSWPKPEAVYQAVDRYQRELGTAVGRGSSRAAVEVQRVVEKCRLQASRFLGGRPQDQLAFTYSGTDSLNLAIHGLLRPGDRVIHSPWEHNSVLRPLEFLQQRQQITANCVRGTEQGGIDLAHLEELLRTPTRLVVVTHASNATGVLQPVEEIVRLAHAHGALVLLDAAQTAGHHPVSFQDLNVDLLACPAHKGLLAPLGTGLLLCRGELISQLQPFRQGGTGTHSESPRQPESGPDRYEAGNHNAPALFGLSAALDYLEERVMRTVGAPRRESPFPEEFLEALVGLPGLRVHLPREQRTAVISLSSDRISPQILATLLEEHFGVETRAGLHCAPLAHEQLGTLAAGGTVRLSSGPFTTADDLDAVLEGLAQITAAM
ncbi:aminotransferase class V-fold PLP-dependent enzyme [Planctomicrobium sp. SH664]|uniref:aminotransferase class V-fold PLP-dependent enzyme n=1 Tax=Planctomicrobium sp. SH664 TaxID=3448125 RepID=UPI003F5C8858